MKHGDDLKSVDQILFCPLISSAVPMDVNSTERVKNS